MADLTVDLGALQAAATELGLLIHEFDTAEDIASDARDVLGTPPCRSCSASSPSGCRSPVAAACWC